MITAIKDESQNNIGHLVDQIIAVSRMFYSVVTNLRQPSSGQGREGGWEKGIGVFSR